MNKAPPFANSIPIDPLSVAANYFSLDCLETTFQLLRDLHPTLALEVQNIIADVRLEHTHDHQEKLIPINIELELVSNIVSALSAITETVVNDQRHCRQDIIYIHQTLLDWLMYAQSFLEELTPATVTPVSSRFK